MPPLSNTQRETLIRLLLRLPNISQREQRQELIEGLPNRLQQCISSSGVTDSDVTSIVNTVNSDAWSQLRDGSWTVIHVFNKAISLVEGSQLANEIQTLRDEVQRRTATVGGIQADTDVPSNLDARVRDLHRVRRYNDALQLLNNADRLQPNTPSILYWRGRTYYQQELYPNAEADFKRGLELAPGDHGCFYYLGCTYLKMREYDKALVALNHALNQRPDDAYALTNRGRVHEGLHQYAEALADYEASLRIKPNDRFTSDQLSRLRAQH